MEGIKPQARNSNLIGLGEDPLGVTKREMTYS